MIAEKQSAEPIENNEIGAGVGDLKEEKVFVREEPNPEVVSVMEDIICQTEKGNSVSSDPEPVPDLEVDNEEDEKITYEGVEYIYDQDQKEIYTVDDMELMGKSDEEEKKIIWEDEDEGPKIHEQLKNV